MDIQVAQGDIGGFSADTIIVNLFAGVSIPGGATGAVDQALSGAITDLIAQGDLTGELCEVRALYPRGALTAKRVIIIGLGDRDAFGLTEVRRAAAAAAQHARTLNADHIATIVHGGGIGGLDLAAAAQATVEGTLLGLYRYPDKKPKKPQHDIATCTLVEYDGARLDTIRAAAAAAQIIADGVMLTRTLVQGPPNTVTPKHMASVAQTIADENGLRAIIGGRRWAAKHDMGAFLAVARGAGRSPRFIVLEYNAHLTKQAPIVLVGKGITFDTGGITLKPGQPMWEMKGDMAGAAAVLGAMQTIARLKLPLRVIGITPCTENKPDADAYLPGDVITASNGTTIEILSTDAEGRMVLADALVYAQRYRPSAVIDLATLTGSAAIAMGEGVGAPFFCTEDGLAAKLLKAGTTTHERLWRMPLWDDYLEFIKSDVADITNSGLRPGGLGASAIFLKQFIDFRWAHLDIAGVAHTKRVKEYETAGASGFGVRLLVELLRNWP